MVKFTDAISKVSVFKNTRLPEDGGVVRKILQSAKDNGVKITSKPIKIHKDVAVSLAPATIKEQVIPSLSTSEILNKFKDSYNALKPKPITLAEYKQVLNKLL